MEERATGKDLCRRCGRCCYTKVVLAGQVYYTNIPCPHLDEETNLCTVYERRFEVNAECITTETGIELGVFPADCPYVKDLPNYKPPHTDCDIAGMGRLYLES